jgi:hypothetical protein
MILSLLRPLTLRPLSKPTGKPDTMPSTAAVESRMNMQRWLNSAAERELKGLLVTSLTDGIRR